MIEVLSSIQKLTLKVVLSILLSSEQLYDICLRDGNEKVRRREMVRRNDILILECSFDFM
jgi:hypothetical protein